MKNLCQSCGQRKIKRVLVFATPGEIKCLLQCHSCARLCKEPKHISTDIASMNFKLDEDFLAVASKKS